MKKLEIMTVRVPGGTLTQIDELLKGGELRSAFIREAVDHEIERRRAVAILARQPSNVDAALARLGIKL